MSSYPPCPSDDLTRFSYHDSSSDLLLFLEWQQHQLANQLRRNLRFKTRTGRVAPCPKTWAGECVDESKYAKYGLLLGKNMLIERLS